VLVKRLHQLLPYKEEEGGSNPSAPTEETAGQKVCDLRFRPLSGLKAGPEYARDMREGSLPCFCVRLFNVTTGEPVAGSEICGTNAVNDHLGLHVRTDPLPLPSRPNEYTVQGSNEVAGPWSGAVFDARLIASWSSRRRAKPISCE